MKILAIALVLLPLSWGAALISLLPTSETSPDTLLWWSGCLWQVKESEGSRRGPGNNFWTSGNVWVDGENHLHLKIARDNSTGRWSCAELRTVQRLGFGTYQFSVVGQIDRLDPNVVLGMFNYPPADVGSDGTNEIDIEVAQWGSPQAPNLNYTVWPVHAGVDRASQTFRFDLNGTYSTHRFVWTRDQVRFESIHGHHDDSRYPIARWATLPDFADNIPQEPMPAFINLWLFDGRPPTDSQEVEIVFTQFEFTPE